MDDNDRPEVKWLMGTPTQALGSTILPILFTNKDTGERFRVKIYVHIVPTLLMGMFMSVGGLVVESQYSGRSHDGPIFTFDLGANGKVKVLGM